MEQKEQILKECIKIAVKNGWEINGLVSDWIECKNHAELDKQDWYIPYEGCWLDLNSLLFNNEFCRKLFGEEKLGKEMFDTVGYDGMPCGGDYQSEYGGYDVMFIGEAWKYHIQELAISEDRIKYLGEWLKTQKL